MSQLTIYRASAGSGKTYRLVMEYLKLLLEDPHNYRHILAVTFTNKATNEMKERILRDLHKVATLSDPKLLQSLVEETKLSSFKIEERARLALSFILHDYDRFAVSTIDSFFQRVLRSFARESGLYGTYEIELDQGAVLEEACDRLLLSVEDDVELRNWLITMSEDQLGEGKTWQINDKILELGKQLFNEAFQPYIVNQESIEVERDKLKILKSELVKIRKWFESECVQMGKKGLALMAKNGLEISDFKFKSSSFANTFNKLAQFKGGEFVLGVRFLKALDNVETWSSKDKLPQMETLFNDGFNELIREVISFIHTNSRKYITALEIQKLIYALGVLTTLSSKVRELGLERNSLLLSEGNTLLRGIIGHNDAPFVYEKMGNYYQYFMIDEFQDTSVTQWENFKPLVSNSLAENHPNLVVGDVKQSIYRWRNSDWQLLNQQLKKDLGSFKVVETPLDGNWRSSENIVRFNNWFFDKAKSLLQENFNTELGEEHSALLDEYRHTILSAYSDVEQNVKCAVNGGLVHCEFIDSEDKMDYEEQTMQCLVTTVKEVQDKGYKARDIAILVKKNSYGKMVAEALLNEKKNTSDYNFEVISDDTLFIESSATVRFLVGMMRYLLTPSDQVIKATVVYEYAKNILPHLSKKGKLPLRMTTVGQQTLGLEEPAKSEFHFIPEHVRTDYFPFFDDPEKRTISQQWAHLSLIDLTEELIHRYYLDHLSGEQANIQAFKDVVNDFSKRESGNLHKFMAWWDQFGASVKLQTAGQRDAIRIMSIHKSKGLEFPVVLLPFCDWMFKPDATKSNILWCSTQSTDYKQFPILPVKFSQSLRNSDFQENYFTEMILSYIDNLNLLYVAQTRAVNALYLFAKSNDKPKLDNVSQLLDMIYRNNESELFNMSSENVFTVGNLVPSKTVADIESNEVNLSAKVSHKQNMGEALRLKRNYIDFLDDSESARSIHINEGKLIHELLSFIESHNDLQPAVQKLLAAGKITNNDAASLQKQVIELLANPQAEKWFNNDYKVLNEATIVAPGFELSRPDRIMMKNDEIIIVDYKATSKVSRSHQRQVKRYADQIRKMGYKNVEGYVWYLKSNCILNVNDEF